MLRSAVLLLVALGLSTSALAQTPVPFPRPGEPQRPAPPPAEPTAPPAVEAMPGSPMPSDATLGVTVYPGAEFITSYDAGRGQRYYLFGTNAPFSDITNYYRTILRQRGELVYDQPPVHMFDLARFREDSMAFPPSVTVKDYTWGGSPGFLHVKSATESTRFRTIIQIVPLPSAPPAR